MYKALMDIGGYKKGDVVPDEKAIIWSGMYLVSPVKKVKDTEVEIEEDIEDFEKGVSNSKLVDDYLGRNTKTVLSNLKKDNFEESFLKSLLKFEEDHKNRKKIVTVIKESLESDE